MQSVHIRMNLSLSPPLKKSWIRLWNCRPFWLLRLVYRSRKLPTLAFIVSKCLKRIDLNSTTLYDPRIRISASMGVRKNFSVGWQRGNFAYPFRLLTIQCKRTYTKRFVVSTQLVCAGWASILNFLSEMFSTLWLSAVFPVRKFYTEQMFVLLRTKRMQLRNHAGTETVKRYQR